MERREARTLGAVTSQSVSGVGEGDIGAAHSCLGAQERGRWVLHSCINECSLRRRRPKVARKQGWQCVSSKTSVPRPPPSPLFFSDWCGCSLVCRDYFLPCGHLLLKLFSASHLFIKNAERQQCCPLLLFLIHAMRARTHARTPIENIRSR